MTPRARKKSKPEPQLPLVNLEALAELLRDDNAASPSELIEMVDAIIQYYEALDEVHGCTTIGLDDLIDARADYRGPGIIPNRD